MPRKVYRLIFLQPLIGLISQKMKFLKKQFQGLRLGLRLTNF